MLASEVGLNGVGGSGGAGDLHPLDPVRQPETMPLDVMLGSHFPSMRSQQCFEFALCMWEEGIN